MGLAIQSGLRIGSRPRLIEFRHVDLAVLGHQFGQVGVVLLVHGNVFVFVLPVDPIQLRHGLLVLLAEQSSDFIGLVGTESEQLQGILTQGECRAEGFAADGGDAEIHEREGCPTIHGIDRNVELRVMFFGQLDQLHRFFMISQGDDEQFRLGSAGGFKQIEAGDITVIDLEPESTQYVHVGFVVIQNDRLYPSAHEHSPQVGAQTPESGQDDGALPGLDHIKRALRCIFLKPGCNQAVMQQKQKRREKHGDGDHGNQCFRHGLWEHAIAPGELKQNEREFTSLGQGNGKQQAFGDRHFENFRDDEQGDGFDHDQTGNQPADHPELIADERKIEAGSDGDEKDAQQQSLERLDVALQLVAVFAVGQHHTGDEGAQGRGQTDCGHQHGDADDQGQGCGDKHFSYPGGGDGAKYGAAAVFAETINESDGKQHNNESQGSRKHGNVKQGPAVMRLGVHRHRCQKG